MKTESKMIFQLSDFLLINFEFYESVFRCEYKDISIKFYLDQGLVITNFDSVLRLVRSPRSGRSIDEESRVFIESDILKLVDGSLYECFSDESMVEIYRIIYFLSIYSFILICEHMNPDMLKNVQFQKCLFFFFIMKENDFHAYGKDWPLFEQTQYEDTAMHDRELMSKIVVRQYGDKLRKYAHINGVFSNEDFAKMKNDISIFYFETLLGFCVPRSKFYVHPDMIDSFLFGVFRQINAGFSSSYAVFNRYLVLLKDVNQKLKDKNTSIFEKKLYRFYLSFYTPFFNMFSDGLSQFLNNITEQNLRLQNDYANGLIMVLLELNYFASILEMPFNHKYIFLNIYFKSPINLIRDFGVFQWNEMYLGRIKDFLACSPKLELKLVKEAVKYDITTFDRMKHLSVAHLEVFKLNEMDMNFYREIITHSKNEFDLLNNLYQAIKKRMVTKQKHIFLILFFSVLNHLKNIFMIKLNNIYFYCIQRYRTHSAWHRQIYDVAKLVDPIFKFQKRDIIDNYDANLFVPREFEIPDNVHYLFQISLNIFFMLQKYYFNIMKKCDISTTAIYRLHLIDFDEYMQYMTYSEMIYTLFTDIKNLTPRKKSQRKLKKPHMNLSNLINKNFESYFYYKSESNNLTPFAQQKRILSMRNHLKKLELKR